jgi:hypothetical protein
MSNTMGTGLAGARPPGMPPPGPHNMPPPMAPPSMTMMNSGSATPLANDFSLQLVNDLGIDPANITNQVFVANVSGYLSLHFFTKFINCCVMRGA